MALALFCVSLNVSAQNATYQAGQNLTTYPTLNDFVYSRTSGSVITLTANVSISSAIWLISNDISITSDAGGPYTIKWTGSANGNHFYTQSTSVLSLESIIIDGGKIGGGIYSYDADDTLIIGNNTTIKDCKTGNRHGGGICALGNLILVGKVTITGNETTRYNGGGIYKSACRNDLDLCNISFDNKEM